MKRFFLFLLLLTASQHFFAQQLQLFQYREEQYRNTRFDLLYLLDEEYDENIKVQLPELPEGFAVFAGPNIYKNWSRDYGNAFFLKTIIRLSLVPRNYGRYILEPLVIQMPDGSEYTTTSLYFEVGFSSGSQHTMPLNVRWVSQEQVVWEGQTIPVRLEIVDEEQVEMFDQVRYQVPDSGIFLEEPAINQVNSRVFGRKELFTFSVRAFQFTPTTTGRITIPAAEVVSGRRFCHCSWFGN
jgi:hypothetical protein